MRLPPDYLAECETRARKYQGQWTGTAGSLAADSMRLQLERRQLVAQIDELERVNAELRQAVEGRQGGGVPKALPDDVPAEFIEQTRGYTWRPAEPQPPAEFSPHQIGATLPAEQLEAVWAGYRERADKLREQVTSGEPQKPIATRVVPAAPVEAAPVTVIGLTGPAGCGKNLVASMIPDAVVMQLADPLYAALAAMLGIPEPMLRHRPIKESPVSWLGLSPRQLLQTLGTEWGRSHVAQDVWLRIAGRKIEQWRRAGVQTVVIADVRFPNEAEWIRARGGKVWRVERDPGVRITDHASEAGLPESLIDLWIDNSGTPEQTRDSVLQAVASLARA